MTEQELQKLNEWIARQLGWQRTEVDNWIKPIDDATIECMLTPPDFLSPARFAEVKREIERRGWDWSCRYLHGMGQGERYGFSVDRDGMDYFRLADTEELAGCLAFRQAVEAVA